MVDSVSRAPGQQQPLRQLQAQFGRHPVRHGRNGHAQPGRSRAEGRAGIRIGSWS